jgi:hypothetical protein
MVPAGIKKTGDPNFVSFSGAVVYASIIPHIWRANSPLVPGPTGERTEIDVVPSRGRQAMAGENCASTFACPAVGLHICSVVAMVSKTAPPPRPSRSSKRLLRERKSEA